MRKPAQALPPLAENPHFDNIERAPYELGRLLKNMPADFSSFSSASHETLLMAAAAAQHASNANDALLRGLGALGKAMCVAGNSDDFELENRDISGLGELIQHLAIEMEFLRGTADDFEFAIREHAAANRTGGK